MPEPLVAGVATKLELAFEAQALSAHRMDSPLYGYLLDALLVDCQSRGLTYDILDGVSDEPYHDAVPLRYLATAHRLALGGHARDLARFYPSCGGSWNGEDISATLLALVAEHRDEFVAGARRNVQTNEVGRAPVLASGFALITRRHQLPLDQLEIGSSAGLLSRWDKYFYDTGTSQLGNPDSALRFGSEWWAARAPELNQPVIVASRRASDISPIDVSTPEGRLTTLSFVWPDHSERIDRLRAALYVAALSPLSIDRGDAGEWLGEQLASRPHTGHATVVFHSIVWQYLPTATRNAVRRALFTSGERARADAPLLWLRMEPATTEFANVRLTTWPGGADETLAEVGYHGAAVRWLAGD